MMRDHAPVRVLAYHSFTPWPDDPLGVAPEEFKRQIRWLADRGWSCLSLDAWVEHLERGTRPTRSSVVLTFDDGYADNLHEAAPILERMGWTATTFVVPDALDDGRAFDHDLERLEADARLPRRRSLTWDEAEDWLHRGFAVGSHTMTHAKLTTVEFPTACDELSRSRERIRWRLNCRDPLFAYPHGDVNHAVIGAVRDAGYRAGVITPPTGGIPETPWTLPRVGIYSRDTGIRFRMKMSALFPVVRRARFHLRGRRIKPGTLEPAGRTRALQVVTSSEIGGIERMMLRLVPALAREDVDADVLSPRPEGALTKLLESRGLRAVSRSSTNPIGEIIHLARHLRTRAVEVVHAYGARALLVSRVAALIARRGRRRGLPIVITGVLSTNHGTGRLRRTADRWTAWLNDIYLSNSLAGARALGSRRLASPERHHVIHDGIDPDHDGPKRPRARVRESLGYTDTHRLVITVANLRPMKGHDVLIRAAADVLRSFPDARFLLIGQDRMGGVLQREAAKLAPGGEIRFLGYREDVADLLGASDVFVLPSDWEGLPVSMLEAMLAGLPVVATAVSGIPEAVTDGSEGFLIPPRDPERLSLAIRRLLSNPEEARRMGRRGRRRVLEEFTVTGMAAKTAALYRERIDAGFVAGGVLRNGAPKPITEGTARGSGREPHGGRVAVEQKRVAVE